MKYRILAYILMGIAAFFIIKAHATKVRKERIMASMREMQDGGPAEFENARDVREKFRGYYRLKPDQRFITAIRQIERWMDPSSEDIPVTAEFDGKGRWRILRGGAPLGEITELPSFEPYLDLVVRSAESAVKEQRLMKIDKPRDIPHFIAADIHSFSPMRIFSAMRRISEMIAVDGWDPATARLVMEGDAALLLSLYDELERNDEFMARAIIHTAIIKELFGDDFVNDHEALLAYVMGYSGHSADLCTERKTLICSFVNNDIDELKRTAVDRTADRMTKHLYALLLARNDRRDDWGRYVAGYVGYGDVSLALIKSEFSMAVLHEVLFAALFIPHFLARDLGQGGQQRRSSEAFFKKLVKTIKDVPDVDYLTDEGFQRLAESVDRVAVEYASDLYGKNTIDEFYKNWYYGTIQKIFEYYFERLAADEAAAKFAEAIPISDEFLISFQRYAATVATNKMARNDPEMAFAALHNPAILGGVLQLDIYANRLGYAQIGEPQNYFLVEHLCQVIDLRPRFVRQFAFDVLYKGVGDMDAVERTLSYLVRVDYLRQGYTALWLGRFKKDRASIEKILADARIVSWQKASGAGLIKDEGFSADHLETLYEQIIAQDPTEWHNINEYCEYLEKKKDYRKAIEMIDRWLKQGSGAGITIVHATVFKARMLYLSSDYEQAWRVIEPAIKSYQSGAMERGAFILEKLGKYAPAVELARKSVERYPSALHSRLVLAQIYWRSGAYKDAAETLKSFPLPLNAANWRWEIAPKFREVFAEKPVDEAVNAFRFLAGEKFEPQFIVGIAQEFGRKNEHETAFRMVDLLGGEGQSEIARLLKGYYYLKRWKGESEALPWLKRRLPEGLPDGVLGMLIYNEQEDDLLWTLIDDPDDEPGGEYIWLLRAAAAVRSKNAALLKRVGDEYRGTGTFYDKVTNYLRGTLSEDDLLAAINNGKRLCEGGYFIGLKAQADGDLRKASDWFQIVLNTGLMNNGEYHWAFSQAYDLKNRARSLSIPWEEEI